MLSGCMWPGDSIPPKANHATPNFHFPSPFSLSPSFLSNSFSFPYPFPFPLPNPLSKIQLEGLVSSPSGDRVRERILTHLLVSKRTSCQHRSAFPQHYSYDAKCVIPPRFRRSKTS